MIDLGILHQFTWWTPAESQLQSANCSANCWANRTTCFLRYSNENYLNPLTCGIVIIREHRLNQNKQFKMSYSHIYLVIGFFLTMLLLEIRFVIRLESVGLDQELCCCNGTSNVSSDNPKPAQIKWLASLTMTRPRGTPNDKGPYSMFCTAIGSFSSSKSLRNPKFAYWDLLTTILMNFCSPIVLGPNFLLSAAHCFKSYEMDGRLFDKLKDAEERKYSLFALIGTRVFTQNTLQHTSVRAILPENVLLHPNYNEKLTMWNSTEFVHDDLALIKLGSPLELGFRIFPSCLYEYNRSELGNTSFIAAGFGSPNPSSSYKYRLRTAVGLKLSENCSKRFTFNQSIALCTMDGNSSIFFQTGDSGMFGSLHVVHNVWTSHTIFHLTFHSICHLISSYYFSVGAPVHFEDSDHRLFVVGILSGGMVRGDRPNVISYSTLVEPYLEWIDGEIDHERCITKEFGPLRSILLALIVIGTCFFLALYSIYLIKEQKCPEKPKDPVNPKEPVILLTEIPTAGKWLVFEWSAFNRLIYKLYHKYFLKQSLIGRPIDSVRWACTGEYLPGAFLKWLKPRSYCAFRVENFDSTQRAFPDSNGASFWSKNKPEIWWISEHHMNAPLFELQRNHRILFTSVFRFASLVSLRFQLAGKRSAWSGWGQFTPAVH